MSNIKVIVTCFGPFGGMPSNPTLSIVLQSSPNVTDLLNSSALPCTYETYELPVSAAGVDTAMSSIFEQIKTHEGPVIIIHCGVDGSQISDGQFKLERMGFNEKEFRIPDNEGYQPRNETIDASRGARSAWLGSMCGGETTPDNLQSEDAASPLLDSCVAKLHAKGWAEYAVPSNSAGRFVCNYALFTSLHRAKEANETRKKNVHVMFLHVPSFELIGEEVQVRFLRDLVVACVAEVGALGPEEEVYSGPPNKEEGTVNCIDRLRA